MSDVLPARKKQAESDLSQVLAHGPAYSQHYGKVLGALLMLFAIAKVKRGTMGIAVAISAVSAFAFRYFHG